MAPWWHRYAPAREVVINTTTFQRLDARSDDLAARAAELVEAEGYVIIDGVLDADRCAALVAEVQRVEREHDIREGTNDFEGFCTRRIFDLIGKSELFRSLVIDPVVLPVVEAILDDGLLLSGTTSMNIGPGETAQLLHADDGMVTLPRPHVPTMVTTLWALSPFTADNGGTNFVPGSHRFPTTPRPGQVVDAVVAADMPAGSVLVLHASLWHGGGANVTDQRRYGLSIQYVAGWCRQQQNLMLGTDPAVAATYPTRLQELIGYSMYRNVMGHVNRQHPARLLGVDQTFDTVWDRMTAERREPSGE